MVLRVAILVTGNEILDGVVQEANVGFLAKELMRRGFTLYEVKMVRDEEDEIVTALNELLASCDLVIVTGGLGATEDDITREAVARALNVRVGRDKKLLKELKDRYLARYGEFPPDVFEKFVHVLEGARLFRVGEAFVPAQLLEKDGKFVVLLPGPPSELKKLFEKVFSEFPAFAHRKASVFHRVYRFAEVPEVVVEGKLRDLLENVEYSTTLDYFVGPTIRVKSESKEILESLEAEIRKRFPLEFFGTDDATLQSVVLQLLKEQGTTLSIAESCTGGRVSAKLVSVPGASEVLIGGIVAYNIITKVKILGVSEDTIKRYDVVSEETALEMARNVREIFGADLGAGVTGVAGPERGESGKDVGTVCWAVTGMRDEETRCVKIRGSRDVVIERASNIMLNAIRRFLVVRR